MRPGVRAGWMQAAALVYLGLILDAQQQIPTRGALQGAKVWQGAMLV